MAHILFITHWFPTIDNPVGGIFVREHARAAALFNEVTVIHLQSNITTDSKIIYEDDDGLRIYRVRYTKPMIPKTGLFSRWRAVRQIIRELMIHGKNPDILHACVYTSSDIAAFISLLYKIPAVLSEHSTAYARNLIPGYKVIIYRICLNRMKLIMPVSHELVNQMTKFGVKAPFEIIPNTVDTTIFYPNPKKQKKSKKTIRIMCVAVLHPRKGIDLLLRAFSLLKLSIRCELIIVGDGPELDNLVNLSLKLGIDSRVIFRGSRTKREVADLMRTADVFVLTSHYETQGVVLIEAMACGLPVLAPEVGGIPEIVKPFCGSLFTPENLSEIVDRMEYILHHRDKYSSEQISDYAISEFSHSSIGKKFSMVYKKVAE